MGFTENRRKFTKRTYYSRWAENHNNKGKYLAGFRPVAEKNESDPDNSEDTKIRMKIQTRIRELYKLGFPKEEAIKRLKAEFPGTYEGFFETWVDNAYTQKQRKEGKWKENPEGEDR